MDGLVLVEQIKFFNSLDTNILWKKRMFAIICFKYISFQEGKKVYIVRINVSVDFVFTALPKSALESINVM